MLIIEITEIEAESNIKIAIHILPLLKALIAEISRGKGAEVGAGGSIKSMAVSIGGLELQSARQALLQAGLQGVVIGERVRTKCRDGCIERLVAVIGICQVARTGARKRLLHRTTWSKGRS